MEKFHVFYHPQGCDNNGNNGPSYPAPGWIELEVTGDTLNVRQNAVNALPEREREHIKRCISRFNEVNDTEHHIDEIQEFCECTCLWGVGFDLRVKEFDEMYEFDTMIQFV